MSKTRLEAFSDGVLAIIITIMVLELKIPNGVTIDALIPIAPKFLSYALSFVFVGIYWNNHHHLLQIVRRNRYLSGLLPLGDGLVTLEKVRVITPSGATRAICRPAKSYR